MNNEGQTHINHAFSNKVHGSQTCGLNNNYDELALCTEHLFLLVSPL